MSNSRQRKELHASGARAIANDGSHEATLIPLRQEDVVFQQMFEYPVREFEVEVGFYINVFGFPAIALTDDYALFKHPENGFCISFRKVSESVSNSISGLKLLFTTTDLPSADTHLEQSGHVPTREIRKGSPVQDVIQFTTPAGLAVEIWQMPTEE